ncbi:MAG: NADH:flavin oxidoreductase [Phocaeicola sp.]
MNTSKILNFVLALCLVAVTVKLYMKESIASPLVVNESHNKTLLDTTKIGNLKLKNRFVRASVSDKSKQGVLDKEVSFPIYEALAKGGVGTILTGYTMVDESEKGMNIFGMYDDNFIADYAELTKLVHDNGSNILMQLVYVGSSYSAPNPSHRIMGASAVKNLNSGITPQEMSVNDIHAMIGKFVDAAVRAKKAGFDGIEMHACHGYLLHQFATSYYNRRNDEYGGSVENRNRFTIEVYEAIRKAVGYDFQVWIKVQSQDGFEGGVTNEECLYLCKELAKRGIDAIEISGNFRNQRGSGAYFKEFGDRLSKEITTPIIVTGGNREFAEMEKMINETNIGYLGLARPLIENPNMINEYINSLK